MNFNNKVFEPVVIYIDVDTLKSQILKVNKGKAGIYQWTHKESNKIYIGSAVDLSKRLAQYFSKSYLEKNKSYINNALNLHGLSSFNLTILEYINITNLSKDEAKKIILEREQYYFDTLNPNLNLLKTAGSSLGRSHTDETKLKLSESLKGRTSPFLGKTHSSETLARISGENNYFYGKTHLSEALVKMSEAKIGENHHLFGKPSEKHPMYGRSHTKEAIQKMSLARKGIIKTEEHKAKISKSMSKQVFVYSSANPTILSHEFSSISEAANHFSCNVMTISKYIKNKKLFQEQWFLSLSKK